MSDIDTHRQSLPIFPHKKCIQSTVLSHSCVVIVGEPGSGKTTQIPQYLHETGIFSGGLIGCTQPRRVAAVTVARRVAEEMVCTLGKQVGYSVRFDDRTSQETRIQYLTDGMLVQESLGDPSLSKYKVIIVDEAHERSLQTDVILGLLKKIQRDRETELHVVVMSATLDCNEILQFFPSAKCLYIKGRQFSVDVMHVRSPEESYLDAVLHCTLQIHVDEGEGDVLVFLTGEEEIESMAALIRKSFKKLDPVVCKRQLLVLTLYAAMPSDAQMKVFSVGPENTRRVILSTNIAETSVTVPGIRFVVDTGVVKQRFYNAKSVIDSLQVVPISQSQAKQRSGRAGRQAPGKVFRLYTTETYRSLEPHTRPEIARTNLAEVVLKLKAMGVEDVLNFEFLTPPPRLALLRSLQILYTLGALDNDGQITNRTGRVMSRFPLEPSLARILIAALETGCGYDMLSVVSMLSVTNVFHEPRDAEEDVRRARDKFINPSGDHLTLLNVFDAYRDVRGRDRKQWCRKHFIHFKSSRLALRKASDVRSQLQKRCNDLGYKVDPSPERQCDTLTKALVAGLFINTARKQENGSYRMLSSGHELRIHPSSVLQLRHHLSSMQALASAIDFSCL